MRASVVSSFGLSATRNPRSIDTPRDGVGEPVILSHSGEVRSLVVLADGQLASGTSDGQIKL